MQRLRWIEPGSFLMGDEREPEKQVCAEIRAGFWLADTACTQALWQALTGNDLSIKRWGKVEHPAVGRVSAA